MPACLSKVAKDGSTNEKSPAQQTLSSHSDSSNGERGLAFPISCEGTSPLTKDEMDEMVQAFKAEYRVKGPSDHLSQVPYLSKLADFYQRKTDWPSLLRAHTLYTSCALRNTDNRTQWTRKAFEAQLKFWDGKINPPSIEEQLLVTKSLKSELQTIREKYRSSIESQEQNFMQLQCEPEKLTCEENQVLYHQLLNEIPELSQAINGDMIHFTDLIVQEALSICGKTPCQFSVVALGSMARGEATPYSDLEFMILLESKSNSVMEYFHCLAMTIYFIIGSLGETKLKYMAIPELLYWDSDKRKFVGHWFEDTVLSGYKIDGLGSWAGNIPTGGGSPEQENHLMCTVDELITKYKDVLDNPHPTESLRGDFSAMLANTACISGNDELHNSFRVAIDAIACNSKRNEVNLSMIESDIKKFDFAPSRALVRTRNVKMDLYRYPSLLVLNLKIIHSVQRSDPWSVIDALEQREILSVTAADCLRFSLCCGVCIRLSAYYYHNSQTEDISVLSSDPKGDMSQEVYFVPQQVLLHMFIHLMPLKRSLADFVTNGTQVIDVALTKTSRILSTSEVQFFCTNYKAAHHAIQSVFPGDSIQTADTGIQMEFVFSAMMVHEYDQAEAVLTHRLRTAASDVRYLYLVAIICIQRCQYMQAMEYYRKAVDQMNSSITDPDSDRVIHCVCLCELAMLLATLSNFKEALTYLRAASDILQAKSNSIQDAELQLSARVNGNIGTVLHQMGRSAEALKYLELALEIKLRLYGDRDHQDLATTYSDLGTLLCDLGKHDLAIKYVKKSLDIDTRAVRGEVSQTVSKEAGQARIATSHTSVGYVLQYQGDHTGALQHYSDALDTMRGLHGGKDHIEMATIYQNLASVHRSLGNTTTALDYSKTSLDMRLRLFEGRDNMDIAMSYNTTGTILHSLGDDSGALQNLNKALAMVQRIFGGPDHPDITMLQNNIAQVEKQISVDGESSK